MFHLFRHLLGLPATTFTRALLLMAIVLATAAPGLPRTALLETSEAASPFQDGDAESLEAAVRRKRRVHLETDNLRWPSSQPSNNNGWKFTVRPPFSHSLDGHRLSNGILAPLIC